MAKSKDNTPEVVAQTVMLPIGKIETNHGQIDGLPKNPRVLRDHHYDALKKSIEDNPEMLTYRELLVFPNKGKYVVIGGNMRLKVLQDLGEKLVPCKIIAEDTPVEKLAAYVIKDNVSGGEWDWDELANAWDEDLLKGWGLELPPDWGEEEEENEEGQVSEDEFDEDNDKIKAVAELGDIWQLGDHRLMCGDSTDAGAWVLLLNGDKADMVFTDPPYGVAIGDKNKLLKQKVSHGKGGAVVENIKNDTLNADQLYDMLVKVMTNLRENCKDDAAYFVTAPQGGVLV